MKIRVLPCALAALSCAAPAAGAPGGVVPLAGSTAPRGCAVTLRMPFRVA